MPRAVREAFLGQCSEGGLGGHSGGQWWECRNVLSGTEITGAGAWCGADPGGPYMPLKQDTVRV